MNKLKPHHSFIASNIFIQNQQPLLIPELWIEIDNVESINFCIKNNLIKTIDADIFQPKSEFVITDINFFNWLSETNFLSYTIFSVKEYFDELPIFFEDEWDENVTTESMCLLGWTVNKYTEPACFYGFYPIEATLNSDKTYSYKIIDKSIVNNFGLIDSFINASVVAEINTSEDTYNEIWRPLAVYVDKITYKKIENIVKD